jgi:hypothetical protein
MAKSTQTQFCSNQLIFLIVSTVKIHKVLGVFLWIIWYGRCNSFLSLWQNTWDNQFMGRKGLFWVMVSEGSVYSQSIVIWLCCLWACGEEEHHGREHMMKEVAYLMVVKKQRERRKGWGPNIPFQDTPPMTYFLQLGPCLRKFSPLPSSWGPSLQHMSRWGNILGPKYNGRSYRSTEGKLSSLCLKLFFPNVDWHSFFFCFLRQGLPM